MRWKPPSQRVQFWLAAPISLPLAAMLAVPVLCMVGTTKLAEWWSRRFGPSWQWQRWYAWRPVRINDWFDDEHEGEWVWLDHIWRRDFRGTVETRLKAPDFAGSTAPDVEEVQA